MSRAVPPAREAAPDSHAFLPRRRAAGEDRRAARTLTPLYCASVGGPAAGGGTLRPPPARDPGRGPGMPALRARPGPGRRPAALSAGTGGAGAGDAPCWRSGAAQRAVARAEHNAGALHFHGGPNSRACRSSRRCERLGQRPAVLSLEHAGQRARAGPGLLETRGPVERGHPSRADARHCPMCAGLGPRTPGHAVRAVAGPTVSGGAPDESTIVAVTSSRGRGPLGHPLSRGIPVLAMSDIRDRAHTRGPNQGSRRHDGTALRFVCCAY